LNARARAANFDVGELPQLMAHLHERGLEGYMCMNVLVFDAELEAAEALVGAAAAAGVDALIIQVLLGC
jgi:putative protease